MNGSFWQVHLSSVAKKQVKELLKENPKIYSQFALLAKEIEVLGPYRKN